MKNTSSTLTRKISSRKDAVHADSTPSCPFGSPPNYSNRSAPQLAPKTARSRPGSAAPSNTNSAMRLTDLTDRLSITLGLDPVYVRRSQAARRRRRRRAAGLPGLHDPAAAFVRQKESEPVVRRLRVTAVSCGMASSPIVLAGDGALCSSAPQDQWPSRVVVEGVLEVAPCEQFGLAAATFPMKVGDGYAASSDGFTRLGRRGAAAWALHA